MYKLLGVFFIIIGLLMFLKSKKFIEITESCKFQHVDEPSDFYVIGVKFGGALFFIVGCGCLVFL